MDKSIVDELWEVLRPFIKEHPLKRDTVSEEDVEMLIGSAVAFGVEDKLLDEVKAHPDGVFWGFLNVIPDGVPPGQEDILEDDKED